MPSPLSKLVADSQRPAQQHNVFAGLSRSSGPTAEPVTTTEAKAHLRVDISDDDALIAALIKAARQKVERSLGKSLLTQTWVLALDGFPAGARVDLPNGPVQSVTTIKTYDEDDTESTLSDTAYFVDTISARVGLNLDYTWPAALRPTNAVLITYVTGYGDDAADVPHDLVQAILLLVGHWYENREASASAGVMPLGVEALLQGYRDLKL